VTSLTLEQGPLCVAPDEAMIFPAMGVDESTAAYPKTEQCPVSG
jgi:hypothetical protein